MAFSFAKLFQFVTGQSADAKPAAKRERYFAAGPGPALKPQPATKRDKIRQTAADEHQARAEKKLAAAAPEPKTPQEMFLAGQYRLTIGGDFQSSNPDKPAVYQVWYAPVTREMFITFFDHSDGVSRPGPTYKYWTISVDEAATMYRDASKGISVWDNYRIRGSAKLHKKHYARVSG